MNYESVLKNNITNWKPIELILLPKDLFNDHNVYAHYISQNIPKQNLNSSYHGKFKNKIQQ